MVISRTQFFYCWNNKTRAGTRPALYMCYHGDRNPRGFYSWKYSLSSVLGTQRCLRRGKKQPVQIGSCKDLFLWMWEVTSVHKVLLWCWNSTPDGEERLQRPQLCVATTFATDWGNNYLFSINLHWALEWVWSITPWLEDCITAYEGNMQKKRELYWIFALYRSRI